MKLLSSRTALSRPLIAALVLFGATFGVAACSDNAVEDDEETGPVCGDGVVDAAEGEQCDGTAFADTTCASLGFDSGDLSCDAQCGADTSACIPLDEDEDGLSYSDELANGTDPTNPDSDGDGVLDGAEVAGGSNPLEVYSWPSGVWPNRQAAADADGVVGTGWEKDQIAPNSDLIDQFGETISLYQFYGYVVVISVGAVWCPPCNQAAASSEQLWSEHVEDGVVFIEVLLEDAGQNPAEQIDIDNWTSKYGITFPVARMSAPPQTPALPTFYFLDREMRVARTIQGFPGDSGIALEVLKLK